MWINQANASDSAEPIWAAREALVATLREQTTQVAEMQQLRSELAESRAESQQHLKEATEARRKLALAEAARLQWAKHASEAVDAQAKLAEARAETAAARGDGMPSCTAARVPRLLTLGAAVE